MIPAMFLADTSSEQVLSGTAVLRMGTRPRADLVVDGHVEGHTVRFAWSAVGDSTVIVTSGDQDQLLFLGSPETAPSRARAATAMTVTAAHRSGFGAVQALPMRLRDETVGALNLFRATPGPFDLAATPLAQALDDVATISLLQQRSSRRSTVLNEQLQTALNSRVLIEQAKGKLAERRGIDMEQAFTALRGYARSHNRRLSDVARAFIDDSEPLPGLGA
ncbi:ANTAR domain-containing protein [Streptomyces mirabilis]|uniref:ANTAR domain-containing protein n=1 Tax=Streptomyces mirabilis TaxID=68239 RepID=UPI002256172C|nr:ANTAR domain-containing protein [Streptomyces mirabilis]MCX4438124.1 ANTAR domain-containing protein [Streptomyces mirabilis]